MRSTKITSKGRVTIPGELRERFGLKKGHSHRLEKGGAPACAESDSAVAKEILAPPLPPRILTQPRRVTSFIERARRQSHDRLRRILLLGPELEAVEFQEENADHKSRPLVAIDKRMVADDARSVQGGHFDHVRSLGICMVLAGAR